MIKRLVDSYRGIIKGTSSGWMVRLLFHAGLGIVATSVFLVVQQQEEPVVFRPDIVPPPKKMDLIKPQFPETGPADHADYRTAQLG